MSTALAIVAKHVPIRHPHDPPSEPNLAPDQGM